MRIVYLHQYFNTPEDSGSTRSYEFAKRLVNRGHEVHVVTSNRVPQKIRGWTSVDVDGIHVHRYPTAYSNAMGVRARLAAFVRFALFSAVLARRLKGEVIFATSTPLTIIIPAWYASMFRGTPIVFEIRDSWPTVPIALGYLKSPIAKWLARRLESFAYRCSAQIVALSSGMAADACEHGADVTRLTVVPNASDVSRFAVSAREGADWREANGIHADVGLVVYSGTFGVANDVSYLIELASFVSKVDSTIVFALIGNGAEEESLRSYATELGLLGGAVRILPPVPKREMPAVLSAASLATSVVTNHPAMNANSANKFFDALAAGRAIAINHEGWQADLIRAHRIGLVLGRENLSMVATELIAFLRDKDELDLAYARSKCLAVTEFDLDQLSDHVALVIEGCGTE